MKISHSYEDIMLVALQHSIARGTSLPDTRPILQVVKNDGYINSTSRNIGDGLANQRVDRHALSVV